jgi:hypothetical protein
MYHGVGWDGFERVVLRNQARECPRCRAPLVAAYRRVRRLVLLRERLALTVQVDRCTAATCPLAAAGVGPPEEARLALPKFTYGLDVLTEIARLRGAMTARCRRSRRRSGVSTRSPSPRAR